MHQPNYQEPRSDRLAMPWVRLHALKDYLDMPLTAAAYPRVKVTFNLVPSLLDQLDLYIRGGTDRHLELARTPIDFLTREQKLEILDTFFLANPAQMILPYQRYKELYKKGKYGGSARESLVSLFSSAELRDIQVWSHLAWVDPMFRREEPVKTLFAKGRHFTEDDKRALFDWQINLIKRIVPTYQKLQSEGRIEVSFTPYYHPILPLLCDTNAATEALPSIKLPKARFVHPEDAEWQIGTSVAKYRELFGGDMPGMWPSEGSVSEDVLRMMIKHGVTWAATDQEILMHSLEKSGLGPADNPVHRVYEFGPGLKLLFRDHALSDRIGFVYSTWETGRAVADFVGHLKRLRTIYHQQLDTTVVPIILDGENAWEYFPSDATEFLNLLYKTLDEDPDIETVTMAEATGTVTARPLPRIFAGSWINHNFKIWIGHDEDNAAWDLLSTTRDQLVRFASEHPGFDADKLKAAWNQIYIAEGSDWCWWYGDEHRGDYNEQFDRIFRQHLIAVYETLGLDVPFDLLKPILGGVTSSLTLRPDSLVTPILDGRITHFYEWSGAGHFDCLRAGGAMHQVNRHISSIYFAYDRQRVHIRLDFRSKKEVELLTGLKVIIAFLDPSTNIDIELAGPRTEGGLPGKYRYCFEDVLEIAVERDFLWSNGHGALSFTVSLVQDGQKLESWPEHERIEMDVPPRDQELFWPI
jgi:alpha-amylase/alpha-mannosidase (GH57 family)